MFVWIVDPQKYADAALHQGYLHRFAGHADVTLVVLNQLDTLAPDARQAALDDLRRLLAADGMDGGALRVDRQASRPGGRGAPARPVGAHR